MSWMDKFVRPAEKDAAPAPPPSPAGIPKSSAARPVPAAIPAAAHSAAEVDQEMLATVDEALKGAPRGIQDFSDALATLADTLPSEDLLYRAALAIVAKKGHTPSSLSNDIEICLRLLSEESEKFNATWKAETDRQLGSRNKEIAGLEKEISDLTLKIATLEETLRTSKEHIVADTERLEDVRDKYKSAHDFRCAQLRDKKARLESSGRR